MDMSDEKNCEGVTHMCDPAVKFGCRDSGEDAVHQIKKHTNLDLKFFKLTLPSVHSSLYQQSLGL